MDRWILCVALFTPVAAGAFEKGDSVVCIRSCEFTDSQGCTSCYLPGIHFTIAAVRGREVQSTSWGDWLPADCVVASKEGEAHFERRIKENPNDVEARCGFAIKVLRRDKDQALKEVNEAVRRRESWITLHTKANIHSVRQEKGEALAALSRALEIAPDQPELHIFMGEIALEKQDPAAALAQFDRALQIDSRNLEALRYRAMVYLIYRDPKNALVDLDAALSIHPTAVRCLETRAGVLLKLDQPKRALDDGKAALNIDPTRVDAIRHCAMAFMKLKDTERAIGMYSIALKIEPEDANTHMSRAALLLDKGEVDKALDDFNEAIRIDPKTAQHWSGRSAAWRIKGNQDRAFADADEAVRLNPKSANLLGNRGALYMEMCEYEKAADDLMSAIVIDPKESRARSRLALIYAAYPDESFRDGNKAKELLRVVAEDDDYKQNQDPDNAGLLMRAMAAVCAESGDFKKAVEIQRIELGFTIMKNDGEGERTARERMALYQAGKPYRLPTKKR